MDADFLHLAHIHVTQSFTKMPQASESLEIEIMSAASLSYNLYYILMPRCPPAWQREARWAD